MKNVIRAWACGEHARKCQLLFATHATKEYLWEYLRQQELLEPEDLIGAIELLRAIERFFDRSSAVVTWRMNILSASCITDSSRLAEDNFSWQPSGACDGGIEIPRTGHRSLGLHMIPRLNEALA